VRPYGHTHRQLVRRIGRVLVVNPGSAGHCLWKSVNDSTWTASSWIARF
jgi:predicted phosphodiesterase